MHKVQSMRTLFLFCAAYRARRHIAICILLFLSAAKIVQAVFINSIFKKINIFLKLHKLNNFFFFAFYKSECFLVFVPISFTKPF